MLGRCGQEVPGDQGGEARLTQNINYNTLYSIIEIFKPGAQLVVTDDLYGVGDHTDPAEGGVELGQVGHQVALAVKQQNFLHVLLIISQCDAIT